MAAKFPALAVVVLLSLEFASIACDKDDEEEAAADAVDTSDDDTLDDDDTGDDDDIGDDDSGDDDTEYDIPCPQGYRIPEGYVTADGCITQIGGGTPGLFGMDAQMGTDGTLHLAVTKGRQIVIYTLAPGVEPTLENWKEEVVYPMGDQVRLIIDEDGVRHIAWFQPWTGAVMYANDAGDDWDIQLVDPDGGSPSNYSYYGMSGPALVVDKDGFVHITYQNEATLHLKYATNQSGSWQSEDVWTEGAIGICNDIEIDSSGDVYILSSSDREYDSIYQMLFSNKSGSWKSNWAESGLWCGSFELASDDTIRLSTQESPFLKLFYDGLPWNPKSYVIDFFPNAPGAFVLDENDVVHGIYSKVGDLGSEIRYFTNESGGWEKETIDTPPDFPDHTSFARDADGNFHGMYHYLDAPGIKYLTNEIGDWQTFDATTEGQAHLVAIAQDSIQRMHMVYEDDHGLVYSAKIDNEWTRVRIAESQAVAFTAESLHIDGNDILHFVYIDRVYKPTIYYGKNAGSGWQFEEVPTGDDVPYPYRVASAIDESGNIYIPYLKPNTEEYGPSTGMWLMSKADGEWEKESIDAAGYSPRSVKIHRDGNISFAANGASSVYYVTQSNDGWVIQTVDPENSGGSITMDIAEDDSVSIAYVLGADRIVYYATNESGSWEVGPILRTNGDAIVAAMRLNEFDAPVIYYGGYSSPQMIVLKEGKWKNYSIDLTVELAWPPSLLIDGEGHHHVGYRAQGAATYLIWDGVAD